MELHDVASTVLINLLYTTLLVLCSPMLTLQSDESVLSSSSRGTTESSTGFDQLVSFEPSSHYIFTNNNGSDISTGVLSIGVDYSNRLSNDYEATGSKTLDSIPSYSRTVESVYGIKSPIYSLTWIPTYSSAVYAGSTDTNQLTLAFESSFIPSSIVIPITNFVTSSFVQNMDVSVLKHQSYGLNFETTFLDNYSAHLEASGFVTSFNIVNAGEIYPTSSIDTLIMPTGTTDTLKSSFAISASSCSLPDSKSLHDDHISALYINITDEIQRTYLNVPGISLNSINFAKSTESLMEQSSGWIQPTKTQSTQVETESLDSVIYISTSHSGFVTSFIYVANADQISYNFQSSSPVHSVNLKLDTSNTENFKLPSPVDGSFRATERMYATGMMDDYLSMQTNTEVTSIYYSVTDVPLYSDLPNGAFLSSSYPHVSTTSSIQSSFDTPAAQDFSRSDYFSFTTDYSVQNVSGGMFYATPVSTTDTAAGHFLATDSATNLSASPTNLIPSQTSFHDALVEKTSEVIGPSFTKPSLNTYEIYKTSVVEVDNDQNWGGQDIASNSQNEVSAGTQLELFIVIGAIAGFAVVVFVFVVIVCLCKQCCSSNPSSVGVKVPLKTTLTTRVDAAKKAITMTHFVKVAPMHVMTKRKVFMDT